MSASSGSLSVLNVQATDEGYYKCDSTGSKPYIVELKSPCEFAVMLKQYIYLCVCACVRACVCVFVCVYSGIETDDFVLHSIYIFTSIAVSVKSICWSNRTDKGYVFYINSLASCYVGPLFGNLF